MGKIGTLFDAWSTRLANTAALWSILPGGVVGLVTAYLASGVGWISQFGAFGWWSAGLAAFFLTTAASLLAATAREKGVYAAIERERARAPGVVNPTDRNFVRKRIRLGNLVRPSTNYVKDKVFTDCQLIGPGSVVFEAGDNFSGVNLINCNWVVVKNDAYMYNITRFQNLSFNGGDVSDITFYIAERDISWLRQYPVYVFNTTGDAILDQRSPPKPNQTVYQNG